MSWNSWDDTWLPADLCADLGSESDCGCHGHDRRDHGPERDDDRFEGRRPRRRRAIRVGEVSVDCTPVSFRTPGQAMNVVSCPVTQVVNTPVTQSRNVQVPTGIPGCVLNFPTTETVIVPVATTVNLPPVLTPVPFISCRT